MLKNAEVVMRWINSRSGRSGSLWTDGMNLYSYDLPIGYTEAGGRKVVKNYTAKGWFISMTTSKHVRLAASVADAIAEVKNK